MGAEDGAASEGEEVGWRVEVVGDAEGGTEGEFDGKTVEGNEEGIEEGESDGVALEYEGTCDGSGNVGIHDGEGGLSAAEGATEEPWSCSNTLSPIIFPSPINLLSSSNDDCDPLSVLSLGRTTARTATTATIIDATEIQMTQFLVWCCPSFCAGDFEEPAAGFDLLFFFTLPLPLFEFAMIDRLLKEGVVDCETTRESGFSQPISHRRLSIPFSLDR